MPEFDLNGQRPEAIESIATISDETWGAEIRLHQRRYYRRQILEGVPAVTFWGIVTAGMAALTKYGWGDVLAVDGEARDRLESIQTDIAAKQEVLAGDGAYLQSVEQDLGKTTTSIQELRQNAVKAIRIGQQENTLNREIGAEEKEVQADSIAEANNDYSFLSTEANDKYNRGSNKAFFGGIAFCVGSFITGISVNELVKDIKVAWRTRS